MFEYKPNTDTFQLVHLFRYQSAVLGSAYAGYYNIVPFFIAHPTFRITSQGYDVVCLLYKYGDNATSLYFVDIVSYRNDGLVIDRISLPYCQYVDGEYTFEAQLGVCNNKIRYSFKESRGEISEPVSKYGTSDCTIDAYGNLSISDNEETNGNH